MRLTKLEMTRFGKFRGEVVLPEAGLTARQQNNESGKTTLADFICFIFYGFEKSRAKKELSENLLEKYQPWDSEEGICGAAEFTDEEGKGWRLERTQDKKGKGEVRLLDQQGTLYDIGDVGAYFLGVDRETFGTIFYIRQSGQAFRRTEQMDVAMKNLITTGNEEVGYDTVMKFLAEEKANYTSPKRGAGKLKRLGEEIADLERRIALGKAQLQQQGVLGQAPEGQIEACDQQLKALEQQQRQAEAFEAYHRGQKRAALRRRSEQMQQSIREKQSGLTAEDGDRLSTAFAEMEGAALLLQQAQEELLRMQQHTPVSQQKEQTVLSHESAAHIGGGSIAAAIGCGGVFAAGVLAALLWHPLCWIGAALGLVGMTLCVYFALRLPEDITKLGIHNRAELRRELAKAKAHQEQLWQYQRELATAAKAASDRKEHLEALSRKYAPYMEKTGIHSRVELEKARQNNMEAQMLCQRLADLRAQMEELADVSEEPLPQDVAAPVLTIEEIELQRRNLQQEKEELLRLQAKQAADRAAAEQKEAELETLAVQLEQKRLEEKRMGQANRVVMIAMEQMEKAQAALRENYAPLLREAMSRKLSLLTDGKYDTVLLDEDLAIRIKAEGGMREMGYFSDGTKDAALLALRLSLAEILEGDKKLPMIFDDPFLHLDPRRMAVLKDYLIKAAQDRQILWLSCREI